MQHCIVELNTLIQGTVTLEILPQKRLLIFNSAALMSLQMFSLISKVPPKDKFIYFETQLGVCDFESTLK